MMMWFLKNMLLSFGITVIMELIVAKLWRLQKRQNYRTVFWVNVLTNPCIVFIVLSIRYWTGMRPAFWIVMIMEIIVWIFEGWIYQNKLPELTQPYRFAVIANMASYGIGCIINLLIVGVRFI